MTWLRNALVYAVDVASFSDGDGDGLGDLPGVTEKLDYLAGLGVTCLWLQPFYPSPRFDDGYDVVDHTAVDERLGSLADLDAIVAGAHRRGMRVLLDLVVNHTSTRHPWFTTRRSLYVWRDQPDTDLDVQPIFPEVSPNVWVWDRRTEAYYLARFYAHEPELDTGNPEVFEEVARIVDFWRARGVDGFRVDAAPYLVQKAKWVDPTEGGHWFLRRLREHVGPDVALVAEADVPPDDYDEYLDERSGPDGVFDFYANNQMFLAMATERAAPLRHAVESRAKDMRGVLVHWVRNHDELDLERLDKDDRETVCRVFAPDEHMRVYGRGIRRRFPPMVDGDRRRVELAHALTFALPGAAFIRYGDEIGMGDDLQQSERMAVRTVMQWTAGRNAGFSSADRLQRVLIESGPFGPDAVNVADQLADAASLLSWFRGLVAVRRALPEIGETWPDVVDAPEAVFALRYRGDDRTLLLCHNLSSALVEATVDGASVRLPPYGYAWFVHGRAE